jgi:hypothetical protein
MNHGHTQTYKTHHNPNLGEATTFPLIIFYVISHGGYIYPNVIFPRVPKLGVPKFPKLGLQPLWRPITSYASFRLRWSLKKCYSISQKNSNDVWHATWTHVIQGNSQLLVVKNQFDTLIPGPSFYHNLCLKHSNESCKLILNIYILKTFPWYKELFNPMGFDPPNLSLKIWESIETPTPKVGVHLGVCGLIPYNSLTLPRVWMWLLGCIFGPHFSMPLPWSQAQS